MRRLIGTAAVAAATLLAAGACGSATSSQDGAQVIVEDRATPAFLTAAAEQTAAAGSFRYETTMHMGGGDGAATEDGGELDLGSLLSMDVTGSGAVDEAAGRTSATMTIEMPFGDLFAGMPSDQGDEVPTELLDDGLTVETVTDGSVSYLRSPMFSMMGGAIGDRWVRVDLDELRARAGELGIDPADLDELATSRLTGGQGMVDPATMLDWLRGTGAEVTEVGSETVRGVATTHLATTVDVGRLLEASSTPEQRDDLERSFEQLGAAGSVIEDLELPIDVYVDDAGNVRRLEVTVAMGDMAGAVTGDTGPTLPEGATGSADPSEAFGSMFGDLSVTSTVDFFDLGEPVEIAVPDASETVSILDVLDDLGFADGELPSSLGRGTTTTTTP